MTEQEQTKAAKARAYMAEHPNATPTELAGATGFTVGSASVWLAKNFPKNTKKKKRVKVRKVVKSDKQVDAQKQALKSIASAEINFLKNKIEGLEVEVASLQYQAIGYRAVISYLQERVGENGVTV